MTDPERVYIDACAFIDLVKFETGNESTIDANQLPERGKDVFFTRKLLDAARANDVFVATSSATIVECSHISEGQTPGIVIQRFFSEILTSGKSGVKLVQPTQSIMEYARELRWNHGITLKPMDAIHAATAIRMRCREILTRDAKFFQNRERLAQLGLAVVVPSETKCLPHGYLQQRLGPQL